MTSQSSFANGQPSPGQPMPAAPPRQAMQQAPVRRPTPSYVGLLSAAVDLVSARILGLLSVLGAIGMFGYATYEPTRERTYAAAAYAILVVLPMVYLYLKKESHALDGPGR